MTHLCLVRFSVLHLAFVFVLSSSLSFFFFAIIIIIIIIIIIGISYYYPYYYWVLLLLGAIRAAIDWTTPRTSETASTAPVDCASRRLVANTLLSSHYVVDRPLASRRINHYHSG